MNIRNIHPEYPDKEARVQRLQEMKQLSRRKLLHLKKNDE